MTLVTIASILQVDIRMVKKEISLDKSGERSALNPQKQEEVFAIARNSKVKVA